MIWYGLESGESSRFFGGDNALGTIEGEGGGGIIPYYTNPAFHLRWSGCGNWFQIGFVRADRLSERAFYGVAHWEDGRMRRLRSYV